MSAAPTDLSFAAVGRGFRDLFAAAIAVAVFGIGFGAAAVEAGLSPATAAAMSGFVFAGAAQYAVLDLWHFPLPWLAILMTTLAINGRHVVLGATLGSYLGAASPMRRYAVLALLSDANWASTRQAIAGGERDLGHLLGGGLLLWLCWVAGTLVGAFAGEAIGDPRQFGVDALMPAFFVCVLIVAAKGPRDVPPWVVAGGSAAGLSLVMPTHWAIIVAALIGAVFGYALDARR
ncbi:putative branched-subunit amino acid permease [Sphingomonas sp. UYAg733]